MSPLLKTQLRSNSPILVGAISQIMRPIVKLLLHYQVSFPQLTAVIKSIYIEVAIADFAIDGNRQTDSRVNFLTGVHRKDIKRLREFDEAEGLDKGSSIAEKILQRWQKNRKYLDNEGKPLALPIRAKNRSKVSFEELVASVCKKNIRAKVILEEWLRISIVKKENDCVTLTPQSELSNNPLHEKLAFFSQNIHDHLIAGSHNLMGQHPPYFDRSVFYDKLSPSSVAQLSTLANKLGMEALQTMNARALELQSEDKCLPENDFRINFGVFNFNDASDISTLKKPTPQTSDNSKINPTQEPIRAAVGA
ncbi:MAG: DUF6502 family protein [Pseudohongiellaceae bacterium]